MSRSVPLRRTAVAAVLGTAVLAAGVTPAGASIVSNVTGVATTALSATPCGARGRVDALRPLERPAPLLPDARR